MRDLFLIGVHESGDYVVLGSRESNVEYRLPIDDAFREAARWDAGFDTSPRPAPVMRPAEVQALIRGGATTEEAAERAGWTVEKVRRFEGPVLAERAHMAEQAGHAHVRGHSFGQGVELRRLVEERLAERDIDPALARWDSHRGEDGQWIVEVRFPAEHQAKVASWRFSRSTMTVTALDEDARAIADDETDARPGDAARSEGGEPAREGTAYQPRSYGDNDSDDNLVADLRERSAARIRRRGARRGSAELRALPGEDAPPRASEPAGADRGGEASGQAGEHGGRPHTTHADKELPFDPPPPSDQAPDEDNAPGAATGSGPAPAAEETTREKTTGEETSKEAPSGSGAAAEPAPPTEAPASASEPEPEPEPEPAPRRRATRPAAKRTAASRRRAVSGAATGEQPGPPAQAAGDPGAPPAKTTARKTTAKTSPAKTQPAKPARTGGTEAQQARPSRAKPGSRSRASVPAWDDIVFGSKPGTPAD